MRQPPRPPPKPPPKPAAKRPAPSGGAKAAKATKAAPRQRGNAAAARHAQEAARQAAQQRANPSKAAPSGKAGPPKTDKSGKPLRGWRSWWATYEMDRRNSSRPGAAARSQVGGGFSSLQGWRMSQVATVFALLFLTMFTGAIAMGAQSIGIGVLAFVFLASALGIVTAARAGVQFRSRPPKPETPLETVADFHIDDLKLDDEPQASDVNSLDDLDRSLRADPPESGKSSKSDEPPKSHAEPAESAESAESAAAPESDAPPSSTEPSPASVEDSETAPAGPTESESSDLDAHMNDALQVIGPTPAPDAATAATDDERHAQQRPAAAKATAPHGPDKATSASTAPEPDAPATSPKPDADSPDPRPASEAAPGPAVSVGPSSTAQERPAASTSAADASPTVAAHHAEAAAVADEAAANPSTVEAEPDSGSATAADEAAQSQTDGADVAPPGVSLSLLAAETPDADLLSSYSDSPYSLPPEAVRDVAATLIVADLTQSVWFYTELLGLVEVDRARDAVLLEAGFGRVLLWRRDDAPSGGGPVMHLTFEVGDIDTAFTVLTKRGVTFTHQPRSALSGAVHDLRAASFLDPDGHGLAITQLRQR